MFNWILFVGFCSVFLEFTNGDIPSYIGICAVGPEFNECAVKVGNQAIPYILKGDKKYKIPNMLPLQISEVNVNTGPNLKLKIVNLNIVGLDTATLVDVGVDTEKQSMLISLNIDKINLLGSYEIDGKILVLPLTGNGRCNITIVDGNFKYTFNYKLESRNGVEYAVMLPNDNLDFVVRRAIFDFDNLFNGNKEMGDQVNQFLNDNQQDVVKELGGTVKGTISAIIRQVAGEILANIPFRELFIQVPYPMAPYIKPCKMYDDACSLKSGQDAIPTLLKGDEKYHLPSLMPLKLPKIEVESGPNFKLTMTDIIVNGLDTMELVDYTHHRDELAFTMHLKSKRLEVLGNYEINGKLLMMPIEGSGPINVTVENSDFVYTFHIELYDRDGETYFNILPNDELTSSSEHAYFHMENLFNGNKELAPYIKPCKRYDSPCAIKSANDALPSIIKGDRKYRVPPMLPLRVPRVDIDSGPNLKIKLSNVALYGLDTVKVVDFIQHRNKQTFTIKVHSKRLELQGTYNVKGRLLILPIEGNGPFDVVTENSDAVHTVNYTLVRKKGEEYFHMEPDDVLDLKIGQAKIKLDNLFNGNKELGDNMNKFLNENFREVYDEVGQSITMAMRIFVRQIIGDISSLVPFKELFID
ncbi:uncharacterized protein LOC115879198 [Sitophilus oryzae]|uniref:Uncharacterized protein LOC115879198 n=1 Tax=Sitophilus oryzae TaxID=7048 RepID=A0A6J2XLJ1_SITOR|nr:uncharacterized protein LOC115879198 [Sitophilus oryzae]